ncbi:MAG: flavodoxin family protein, partial [Clostridiales bacterium]|nr:flavodoxin family protein [Clostridiales bacterium]
MKVLGICCGRINGNTEILMKEAFKTIQEKCGAECSFIRLQEADIRSCIGCETCMINHLKGNWDFRCVHKNGTDHFYFIEQMMREADAIIVSAPAYNLQPPGNLVRFLNKLHASGNYRDVVHKNNKIGATFTLGGTDWTNFTLSTTNMLTMELVGSYEAIVDKCHFDFVPSV